MVLQKSRFHILIALYKCEGGSCKNVVFISSAVVNGFWNCAAGRSQFAFAPPKKKLNEDLWHFKRLWWWFWSVMSLELLPAVAMASFSLGVGPPWWKRDSLQSEAGSHCLSQKRSQLFGLAQLQPPHHSILLNAIGITMTPPVTSRAIRIPCLLIAHPAQHFLSFNKITWNTLY